MKMGKKSVTEMAQEIDRQMKAKKDFIAETNSIQMVNAAAPTEGEFNQYISLGDKGSFKPTEYCHGQIASRLQIPKQYYDRIRKEAPVLLLENVNTLFNLHPEPRMLRTLGPDMRAFLSDKYRPLDNYDLIEVALPIITEQKAEIVSCEVTEQHMYIKALFPKVEAEVKKGDIVQAGIVISNSEIGAGTLQVQPLIYRLACLNGMITNASMRQYHLGRSNGGDNEAAIRELMSTATKKAVDVAFWKTVHDIIQGSFRKDVFEGNVDMLREAADRQIKKDPVKVVEIITKEYGLGEKSGGSIMQHLIAGGDLSQWGLANAVTRTANDADNYEQATELERTGGKIIELAPTAWEKLAA